MTIGRKKYKIDLVPPPLIIARYFAEDRAAIESLQTKQETAARELKEFIEEHIGEVGLLEDAANDAGNITKGSVMDRLNTIKEESESDDECDALTRCLELIEAESFAAKATKTAQVELDAKVLAKYSKLSETEIKTIAVEDKWFASIQAAINGEVQQMTQQLACRVKELKERYAQTMPMLEQEVNELSKKMKDHLKQIGLEWK